jgi:hypothetical protein
MAELKAAGSARERKDQEIKKKLVATFITSLRHF